MNTMDRGLKDKIVELVEGRLAAEGFELAEVVLSRYKANATVRVFVYAEGGVNLDACARLSRIVGDLIDDAALFADGYALEVSSPGLDRPLTTARDFRYRVGETVKLEFTDPKRKKVSAEIVGVADDIVEFRDDSGAFTVPLAELEKARIIY